MSKFIDARVIQKTDTEEKWSQNDLKLYKGELALVQSADDVVNIKVGTGNKTFRELPYLINYVSGLYTKSITRNSRPSGDNYQAYIATEVGKYPNFGNVEVPKGFMGVIFKNLNNFEISLIKLPNEEDLQEYINEQLVDANLGFGGQLTDLNQSPTVEGIYIPKIEGNYPNFNNLTYDSSEGLVMFLYKDGQYQKIAIPLDVVDNEVKNINTSIGVSGQAVEKFAVKKINNISELRNTQGEYEGQLIELLGYYEAGDKEPLNYKWLNTQGVDDGGSVINSVNGSWAAKFGNTIKSSHFGLITNIILTAEQNKIIIQNTFEASYNLNIKEVYLDFVGTKEITGGGITYRTEKSNLYFLGELKLADWSNDSEVQFIRYRADDINVYNQMLDGNRLNNTFVPVKGVQCNFTTYGIKNPKFIGGYSINALQSHLHSTAENLIIEDSEFNMSGEHGLYLTLDIGQPKKKVTLRNVTIKNFSLSHNGSAVSVRSIRNGVYENCIFDAGDMERPENSAIFHISTNYRDAPIAEGEEFKHVFTNCTFLKGDKITNCVICNPSPDVADGSTTESNMSKGLGVYINGGFTNMAGFIGCVIVENMTIQGWTNMTIKRLPRNVKKCVFKDIHQIVPTSPNFCKIEDCEFDDSNSTIFNGRLFNFLNTTLVDANYIFKGNTFINFNNTSASSSGIIYTNNVNNNNFIIDSNVLINCNNAQLAYVGNSLKTAIINNIDATLSGVKLRFDNTIKPMLVSNNNFQKTKGTTTERPSGNNIYVGYKYYDTTLNTELEWNGNSWIRTNPIATATINGSTKQSSAVSNITTADASDLATALTLVNELKSKLNAKLTADRNSGQQAN